MDGAERSTASTLRPQDDHRDIFLCSERARANAEHAIVLIDEPDDLNCGQDLTRLWHACIAHDITLTA